MKLSIAERFNLTSLLPTQGDFITLKRVQEFKDKLIFTEEEVKKYEIKLVPVGEDKEQWRWNDPKYETEIEVGETIKDIIVEKLKNMDKEKTLETKDLSLYEKFIKE